MSLLSPMNVFSLWSKWDNTGQTFSKGMKYFDGEKNHIALYELATYII